MFTRKYSKFTNLWVPLFPLLLTAMGCASESDSQPDESRANMTADVAAKGFGKTMLAMSGITPKTDGAKALGIEAWNVYAVDGETKGKERVNGAVAFGVDKSGEVLYAILVDASG